MTRGEQRTRRRLIRLAIVGAAALLLLGVVVTVVVLDDGPAARRDAGRDTRAASALSAGEAVAAGDDERATTAPQDVQPEALSVADAWAAEPAEDDSPEQRVVRATLAGRVVDIGHRPVPGARVSVLGKPPSGDAAPERAVTLSDEYGRFVVSDRGRNR